jgi:hypothetical protein
MEFFQHIISRLYPILDQGIKGMENASDGTAVLSPCFCKEAICAGIQQNYDWLTEFDNQASIRNFRLGRDF